MGTNRAENRALDRAVSRAGNRAGGGEAGTWRDDVANKVFNWRYGEGETQVSDDLDIWEDLISAKEVLATSAVQRPTDGGDGWVGTSANSVELVSAVADLSEINGGPFSVNIRTTKTNQTTNQTFFALTSSGTTEFVRFRANANPTPLTIVNDGGGASNGFGAAFTAGDLITLGLVIDGTEAIVYQDGVEEGRFASGFLSNLDIISFFSFVGSDFLDGKVSEVLITSDAKSGADMLDIHNNLATDYPN